MTDVLDNPAAEPEGGRPVFPSDVLLQSNSAPISLVSVHHRDEPEPNYSSWTLLNPTQPPSLLHFVLPAKLKILTLDLTLLSHDKLPLDSFNNCSKNPQNMSRTGLKP